jgi:hypothetical protein
VSDEAVAPPEEAPDLGLTLPRRLGLVRVPIRSREIAVTLSAWRLFLLADEGEGMITRLESREASPLYRGDGVCLGWTQERLARAYELLRPREDAALSEELPQLG